jgi:hypothetical protein
MLLIDEPICFDVRGGLAYPFDRDEFGSGDLQADDLAEEAFNLIEGESEEVVDVARWLGSQVLPSEVGHLPVVVFL